VVVVVVVAFHASSLSEKLKFYILSIFSFATSPLKDHLPSSPCTQPLLCGLLFCLCAPSVVVVVVVVTTTLGYMVAR
jgi:hypothetical protein